MKVIKNSLWIIRKVFSAAPVMTIVVFLCEISVALFRPLQIVVIQKLVDHAGLYITTGTNLAALCIWGGILVAVLTLWVTLQKSENYLIHAAVKKKLILKVSPEILEHLRRLPYAAFEDKGSNDLFEKLSDDPAGMILSGFIRIMVSFFSLFSIFATVAVLFAYSFRIGIGAFLITVPMTLMTYYSGIIYNSVWASNSPARRHEGDLRNLTANKHAIYEMRVFCSTDYIEDKWNGYHQQMYAETKKGLIRGWSISAISKLFSASYIILTAVVSVSGFINGIFTLGALTALMTSVSEIMIKLDRSSGSISAMFHVTMKISYLIDFFQMPEKETRTEELPEHFDIRFSHVSFQYPNTDKQVLSDINLHIKEGENIAFVGENGSGKTTLIKLLCGLYPITSGTVTVGGKDLAALSDESRQKLIAVLFQDFQNYWLSIRENVAIGNIEKLNHDEDIVQALKMSHAEDLLSKSSRGIDARLGKLTADGIDLSKGQWQRLAMSRAFISDAKFVALDEPTASLDPIAECSMYENFRTIFQSRSAIMISHRLASAKMADRIFVLDKGRIAEEGTHETLMAKQGIYHHMFTVQSSWYREGGISQ